MATLLPPNKLVDVVFALPKTEVVPKLGFDGDAGAVPPKIDAVLVALFAALPPKIFWAGFAAAAAVAKMFPVDVGGLADDAGVDDSPKLANDNDDVLSAGLAPKTLGGCCWFNDVSGVLAPPKILVVVLVVGTELALKCEVC